MDGMELANQVRKIDSESRFKIILLSADEPSSEFKNRNLFNEIYIKPLKMSKLTDMCS